MTPEERKEWQDLMKEVLAIIAEFSELSKKISELYEKINDKLNGE